MMDRIKVLIMLPHLRTGGGQRLAVDEAIGLKKDPAFDVKILCIYGEEDNVFTMKAKEAGLDVRYLGKGEGASLQYISKVTKFIKSEEPDIVNTHLLAMPYALGAAFLYRKAKYYHTIHSVAEKEAGGMMGLAEKTGYHFTGFSPIAISDYCRDTIIKFYRIKKDKIPVIYNGIDTARFSCVIPYIERNDSIIRIISTGRMQQVKRHVLMVEAFAEVHKTHPNTELVFLGDGELRPEVEKTIRETGTEDCITLRGVVKNVEEELNNAHIYLLGSDFEGLPLSVLEAMSCGLPIVATRAGGTVDIVREDNGILCDVGNKKQLADALCTLVESREMRERMSERSIQIAAEHDLSRCAREYGDLFKKAVGWVKK